MTRKDYKAEMVRLAKKYSTGFFEFLHIHNLYINEKKYYIAIPTKDLLNKYNYNIDNFLKSSDISIISNPDGKEIDTSKFIEAKKKVYEEYCQIIDNYEWLFDDITKLLYTIRGGKKEITKLVVYVDAILKEVHLLVKFKITYGNKNKKYDTFIEIYYNPNKERPFKITIIKTHTYTSLTNKDGIKPKIIETINKELKERIKLEKYEGSYFEQKQKYKSAILKRFQSINNDLMIKSLIVSVPSPFSNYPATFNFDLYYKNHNLMTIYGKFQRKGKRIVPVITRIDFWNNYNKLDGKTRWSIYKKLYKFI